MPKIPVFTAEGTVARYNPPMQDPYAMGAPGRALAEAAGNVAQVGGEFLKKYEDAKRQADAAEATATGSKALADAEFEASKLDDSAAAQKGFDDKAAKIQADTLAGASTDSQVQAYVKQQLTREALTRSETVRRSAFTNEANKYRGQLDANLAQYEEQASTDPNMAVMAQGRAMADIGGAEAAGYINGEQAQAKRALYTSNVTRSTVMHNTNDALLTQDPELAALKAENYAQYLRDHPEGVSGVTPQERETLVQHAATVASELRNRADIAARQREAELRGQLQDTIQNNIVSRELYGVDATPVSNATIRAAYGDEADKVIGRLSLATSAHQAVAKLALGSPGEDAAVRAEAAPRPGSPNLADQLREQDVVERAYQQKVQALGKDPAAYVMSVAPDIAAKALFAQQNPAKNTQAYVTALDGAYDRLGLPQDMRRVLSEGQAQQLTATIMGDAEHAPDNLEQLQTAYGQNWPRAFFDLSTLGKLPAQYQLVPTIDNKRYGALLSRWSAEIGRSGKKPTDLLGEQAVKDIDASVEKGLSPLLYSMSMSGSSLGQLDANLSAAKNLGYALSWFEKDPTAADNAIAATAGKYQYMQAGGARVPLDKYDNVNRASQALLDKLTVEPSSVAVKGVLSEGVNPDGSIPGRQGNLDPNTAGKNWATTQIAEDGTERHYVLPTQPGDRPADEKTGFLGDAAERYRKTGKHYGAFDTDATGEAFMARAQSGKVQIQVPPEYTVPVPFKADPRRPKPEEYADHVRYGPSMWITSPRADALWLMDPEGRLVRGMDGKPLAVPFDVIPPPPDPFEAVKGVM